MTGRYRGWLYVGYGLLAALGVAGALLVITRRPAGLPVQLQTLPTPLPVRVHVAGAVVSPGVYSLPPGSIVQDALAAAGGATPLANLSLLNLAHQLTDGEQVLVPALAPTSVVPASALTPGASPTRASATAGPGTDNRMNINTASAAELVALPHVGPALGQRIVDYRGSHGPFRTIEDVMQVKGIGPAIFAQIKDLIAVN